MRVKPEERPDEGEQRPRREQRTAVRRGRVDVGVRRPDYEPSNRTMHH
jgi:hypothetical protein